MTEAEAESKTRLRHNNERHKKGLQCEPKVFDQGMDDRGIVKERAPPAFGSICTSVYTGGEESQYKN